MPIPKHFLSFYLTLTANFLFSSSVFAGFCEFFANKVTGGKHSTSQVESVQSAIATFLNPQAGTAELAKAVDTLSTLRNSAARVHMAQNLVPAFIDKLSSGQMSGYQANSFGKIMSSNLASAMYDTRKIPIFLKEQYKNNISSIPPLAQGFFLFTLARTGGSSGRTHSSKALLNAADDTVINAMAALDDAVSKALSSKSPEEIVEVADSLISFNKKESMNRDRSELRTVSLTALEICFDRLKKWQSPDYVMSNLKKFLELNGHFSRQDFNTFTSGNTSSREGIDRILFFMGARSNSTGEEIAQKLRSHLEGADSETREKIQKNINFAQSDSVVLKNLAATFLSSLPHK